MIGLLIAVLLVGALVGAYMLSRDPGVALENPNAVEALRFKKKLGRYESAKANGDRGFVRFTPLEINSYIHEAMTNSADTNATMHLRKVGVGLGNTNVVVYSWGECHLFGLPLKFVVQRGFEIQRQGTNGWNMPLESFKIGEVEVPKRWWDSASAWIEPLDQPVKETFAWHTNIPALFVTKNELSDRPELRLYTYPASSPSDTP
jgi:hypothetical protein